MALWSAAMSVDPIGNVSASAAGSRFAQINGADVERAQHDAAAQKREIASSERAKSAAGIGAADGESIEVDDRDADGRRPWELPASKDPIIPTCQPGKNNDKRDGLGGSVDLVG